MEKCLFNIMIILAHVINYFDFTGNTLDSIFIVTCVSIFTKTLG